MMSYDPSSLNRNKTILEAIEEVKKFLIAHPCYKVFYANTNYLVGTTTYSKTYIDDADSIAEYDVVFFNNNYYGKVESVGDSTFSIIGATNFKGDTGSQGPQGPTGPSGADGQTGISITNVSINASNHLICTLSNGTTIDAGLVPDGPQGPTGPQGLSVRYSSQNYPQTTYDTRLLTGETANMNDVVIFANGYMSYITSVNLLVHVFTIDAVYNLNGTNGTDGAYVSGATINASNHLIITLSNGTTIDAGEISGGGGGGGTPKYMHRIEGSCTLSIEGTSIRLWISCEIPSSSSTPLLTIADVINTLISSGYDLDLQTGKPNKLCTGHLSSYQDGSSGFNIFIFGLSAVLYSGQYMLGGYIAGNSGTGTPIGSINQTFGILVGQDSDDFIMDDVIQFMQ